ncbi:unnamed protein product [Thlaspi arvense]|uniref:Uncharacterized protein n=1 Tax=Thlaspi arvense TaxID=13288 RepID=A0AAU9RWE0_THLAR|nr:unnamed protein product [Thlaspi arvense]
MARGKRKGSKDTIMEAGKLHIMMFPWLAFGHIIPYLELAKLIAGKGHRISFISTPGTSTAFPNSPRSLSPHHTHQASSSTSCQSPQGAESTTDISYDKVKHLKISYDGLREPFAQLLRSSSPDWLFFDFTSYWVPTVAAEISIPTAFFFIFNAAFSAFLGPVPVLMGTEDYRTKPEDFTVAPKWIPFKSTLRYLPFEIARIFNDSVSGNDENISDIFRIGAAIKGCDLVLLKSCSEFEPEWFNLLEELHQKPVIPTGLLPVTPDDGSDGGVGWREIKEWLDEQGKGSVVYVAFGSEAKLSQDELTQIANGLELSGLPFFWVLKKLSGLGDGDEQIELPDGLEERTKDEEWCGRAGRLNPRY